MLLNFFVVYLQNREAIAVYSASHGGEDKTSQYTGEINQTV